MKISILLILLAGGAFVAQKKYSVQINWSDATRDVYIDNELDRDAQVLTSESPSQLAVISSKLESAIVLDVNEHTMKAVSKDTFKLGADRTTATSDLNAEGKPAGKFTRVDGPIYFFVAEGKPVLIKAHPGFTGEMTMDKLWETVPVWRAVMKTYEPNPQAVTTIKSTDQETNVTLAFGTWCPDSKNYMPRLIKALRAADNAKIHLKLIGIDNQFHEPVAYVQPLRIINVPTVIVERGGSEIGRIVETPASGTIEQDLAAILEGKPLVHNGRWDRGPRLASGVYSYRDHNDKEIGSEVWDLFRTAEGGQLVHSRITTGDLTTEVFYRVDARRRPSFVEVTKTRGDERTRTRFNFEGRTMTARMRGSVSGVISQTLELPDGFFLSTPAIAAEGLLQFPRADHSEMTCYYAPRQFDRAMGTLSPSSFDLKGEETVRVPAGEFRARHVFRKSDHETSEWWFHPKLAFPVQAKFGETELVLTSLKM